MEYWSARSPEIHPCCCFLGGGRGISTDFRINFGADFVLCIKLGVLSPQVSSWGSSSPHSPPPPRLLRPWDGGIHIYCSCSTHWYARPEIHSCCCQPIRTLVLSIRHLPFPNALCSGPGGHRPPGQKRPRAARRTVGGPAATGQLAAL